MSTIKSSAENLTLNADGANNDIKFQSNGSEVASIDQAGVMTATSFAGSGANLTGVGVDGITSSADATAITIDSSENVGIGVVPETWDANYDALQIGGNGSLAATPSQAAGGKTLLGQNMYVDSSYKYISTDEASLLYQQNGAFQFRVAASGSADAAITWTTGFEVLNDGKARAKNGLLFGTDTATANNLDDYEEGTWTPTLGPGSGQSYASQVGTYTKVGNVVHCWVDLTLSARGSITGSARILGLPFTPVSSPGIKPGSFICQNLNIPSGHKFTAGVYAANAFLYIWEEDVPPNGGVSQPGGEAKFTNNSAMWGSFSYIAS